MPLKALSIGKLRRLQQISTADGFVTICAIDHRGSLLNMVGQGSNGAADYQTMVQLKIELCQSLAPCSSAILLDPVYGAAQTIASGVLPGRVGLLLSMEASGYEAKDVGRITQLLEGWNVAKIRKMGGSAAKLLLYYRPDLTEVAPVQLQTARKVADDCQRNEVPFLLETVTYAVKGEDPDSAGFASRKSELVIQTAGQVSGLAVDVFKAEFPADMRFEKDQGKLLETCRKLDQASLKPWVLLSAGVGYETYAKQMELACRAGASGYAAGRAIWQEGMAITDARERVKYLKTVAADRLKRLNEIVAKYGTPWYRKLKLSPQQLTKVPEDWHKRY
ncbi:MAG: tagatose 1,6-diphosphate aldolase [Chloroflexi bacterium]|nr:tagatose 1,6-diphosphate aldolase [Chloroflexota bacterium]